ncbi:MAG: hypothetical protein A3F18_03885 [Legionellales bacterium RIFCSPHIGHO2_12_FULL_37_14]|nr:MAG: hypothetical protein A3F18_03885 [Legionellales bacterium RIFCSPHIGHO2_12_FULL_37_14]
MKKDVAIQNSIVADELEDTIKLLHSGLWHVELGIKKAGKENIFLSEQKKLLPNEIMKSAYVLAVHLTIFLIAFSHAIQSINLMKYLLYILLLPTALAPILIWTTNKAIDFSINFNNNAIKKLAEQTAKLNNALNETTTSLTEKIKNTPPNITQFNSDSTHYQGRLFYRQKKGAQELEAVDVCDFAVNVDFK